MPGTDRAPDVLVIGAGLAGAATALCLQRAGHRTLLLDAKGPGASASGRNPGFLWLQTKSAGPQMAFALRCRAFAEDWAAQLDDRSFRACGGLILWRDGAEESAAAFVEDRCAAGLPVALLDRKETEARVPWIGPTVRGAVWNAADAHQDTPRLSARTVAAFAAIGGRTRFPAKVASLLGTKHRCTGVVLTDGSRIEAAVTVLASGPAAPELLEPLGINVPLQRIRFEAASTAPAPFRIGPVIAGQALFRFIAHSNGHIASPSPHPAEIDAPGLSVTEQIVSMPDGRIAYGCAYAPAERGDEATPEGRRLGRAMAITNLPAINALPEERAWAGLVAAPADGMPIVDVHPGPEGLALNFGHFFGNLAGAFSGQLISDWLAGTGAPDPALQLSRPAISATIDATQA